MSYIKSWRLFFWKRETPSSELLHFRLSFRQRSDMLRSPRPICAAVSLAVTGRPFYCPARSVQPLLFHTSTQKYGQFLCPVHLKRPSLFPPQCRTLTQVSDPNSLEYTLIYSFPAIKGLRALSRLKLVQTGITVVLLPCVFYFYLEGQASLSLLSYTAGIAAFAAVMLYAISHYARRVVGMMYLDSSHTTLKVSHLSFWGHRREAYLPVSDVMTLGDSGDSPGEPILRLRRYSCPDTLYFSTRLGRVVHKCSFEKVFGALSP